MHESYNKKNQQIQSVKGMNDLLPSQSKVWIWLEQLLINHIISFGYENIRTPVLENAELFLHALGDASDVVEKEMYSFVDHLNGEKLALRPEGTAPIVRSITEHRLLDQKQIHKLWYLAPMFRHEKPQRGRYRQFHQFGVEVFGILDPIIEAEMIAILHGLWQKLHIPEDKIILKVNCIGELEERAKYIEALSKYLTNHIEHLDENTREKINSNPLRILDSKNQQIKSLIYNKSCPKITDYLSENSKKHYQKWLKYLNLLNIQYIEDANLVRGLDYYNLSVFEWIIDYNTENELTLCGGGRYDQLIKSHYGSSRFAANHHSDALQLGIYASGFAIGIERLLLILEKYSLYPAVKEKVVWCITNNPNFLPQLTYYANYLNASDLLQSYLGDQFAVVARYDSFNLKSHLKKANSDNVDIVVIITDIEGDNSHIGEGNSHQMQIQVKFMHEKIEKNFNYNVYDTSSNCNTLQNQDKNSHAVLQDTAKIILNIICTQLAIKDK